MTLAEALVARGFALLDSGLNDFQIERDFGNRGAIYVGGRHGRRWAGIDQGTDESCCFVSGGEDLSDEQILTCVDALIECMVKIEGLPNG